MAKPKPIQWLEDETGQSIEYTPEGAVAQDRHLSVRVNADLAAELEAFASERGLTLSQLVRQILGEAAQLRRSATSLDSRELANRLAADVAEVRRRLTAANRGRCP